MFVPIFVKDGNRLFLPHADFAARTDDEAYQIGLGASLVECILMGMRFEGETLEIDPDNIPHQPIRIGQVSACVVSGPLFAREVSDG